MLTVKDIHDYLDEIAPPYMKEEWDNVGLLLGDETQPVKTVLIALDPFSDVIQEAIDMNAQLIITHHPLIFTPIKSITSQSTLGNVIICLAQNHISAINAHTNLDVVLGGVNDCLAKELGLENVSIPFPIGTDQNGNPYGLIRTGTVAPTTVKDFSSHVKQKLRCEGIRYVDGGKPVHRVAVGGGACASELNEVIACGCDTFVTSDVKYNQFWDAKDAGINLIDAGHYYTENPVCQYLYDKMKERFPELTVNLSKIHKDPVIFG